MGSYIVEIKVLDLVNGDFASGEVLTRTGEWDCRGFPLAGFFQIRDENFCQYLSICPSFVSVQAKPYKNDPEILAMTNLVSAYQNNDINEFEKILKNNRRNIMDDPFIREHIEGS